MTGVYELPFGRGKKFVGGANRVVDEVIGGWKLSGSNVTYSALPVTASSPANYSSTVFAFTGAARPDQIAPVHIVNRSLNQYFGTTAQASFSPQPSNAFGNVRPFSLRGPGYEQIDMSLQKTFSIFREHALDFRVDGFNLFNIASYLTPDSGITDSNYNALQATIRQRLRGG